MTQPLPLDFQSVAQTMQPVIKKRGAITLTAFQRQTFDNGLPYALKISDGTNTRYYDFPTWGGTNAALDHLAEMISQGRNPTGF